MFYLISNQNQAVIENMKSLETWLEEYGRDHQNLTNQKIHFVCVPLIFFSIVGALHLIPFQAFGMQIGYLLIWTVFLWYVTLGSTATILMAIQTSGALGITICLENFISFPTWMILAGVFVVAWIGQFYGHHLEGKRPSFLRDLQYLLIGPLWVWLGHKPQP